MDIAWYGVRPTKKLVNALTPCLHLGGNWQLLIVRVGCISELQGVDMFVSCFRKRIFHYLILFPGAFSFFLSRHHLLDVLYPTDSNVIVTNRPASRNIRVFSVYEIWN